MKFYKHWIGDYKRDTEVLSLTEHGAYRLMLDCFYATGKPLPLEPKELYRLLRAENKTEKNAVDLIRAKFWLVTPEGLINKRAKGELEKAEAIAEHNRQVGKQGGRPKVRVVK